MLSEALFIRTRVNFSVLFVEGGYIQFGKWNSEKLEEVVAKYREHEL